jgi:hypothetical protein
MSTIFHTVPSAWSLRNICYCCGGDRTPSWPSKQLREPMPQKVPQHVSLEAAMTTPSLVISQVAIAQHHLSRDGQADQPLSRLRDLWGHCCCTDSQNRPCWGMSTACQGMTSLEPG